MNPLTTQDIAAGWFIIGVVTCLAGIGVIALVRSAWSEKRARKAERTMSDWSETARIVADACPFDEIDLPPFIGCRDTRSHPAFVQRTDDNECCGIAGHFPDCPAFVDTRLADHTAQFERRLSPVAPVVPLQRGAVD